MPECLSAYTEVFLLGNQTHKIMFSRNNGRKDDSMAFFNSAVGVLQTLVIALGAGLGIWGIVNLLKDMGTTTPAQNHRVLSSLWQAEVLLLSVQPLFRFFADCSDKEVTRAEHT